MPLKWNQFIVAITPLGPDLTVIIKGMSSLPGLAILNHYALVKNDFRQQLRSLLAITTIFSEGDMMHDMHGRYAWLASYVDRHHVYTADREPQIGQMFLVPEGYLHIHVHFNGLTSCITHYKWTYCQAWAVSFNLTPAFFQYSQRGRYGLELHK